jgi:hypothetical protein
VQIRRALADYEMLTKQELALWTKDLSEAASEVGVEIRQSGR